MKAFLKSSTVAVATFTGVVAVAAGLSLADVNHRVVNLLAPFQNPNTEYELVFDKLTVDATRATDFAMHGNFLKKGAGTQASLAVKDLTYAYGNAGTPTAKVDAQITADFVKVLGQENLNMIAEEAQMFIDELSKEYGAKYGTALTVVAQKSNVVKDAAGNVQSLELAIQANVDLAALPAGLNADEVEFQGINLAVQASTMGASLKGQVVMNPAYKGFRVDQDGMKEYIEKLLTNNADSYKNLGEIIKMVDNMVSGFVK